MKSSTDGGVPAEAPGFPGGRHRRIVAHLETAGYASNRELLALLGCSPSTLRRDLEALELEGLLRRKRGGAVSLQTIRTYEPSTVERMASQLAEKRAIARYAAQHLVDEDDVLLLDSGTTTLALAHELLADRRTLTVVTNSIPVASVLATADNVHLLVTGGECRQKVGSLVGEWHRHALGGVRVRTYFLGGNAVSAETGVSTPNLAEAEAKRSMLEAAERVVLLVDHTKLGRTSFASVCPLGALAYVVTDDNATAEQLAPFHDAEPTLVVAPVAEAAA